MDNFILKLRKLPIKIVFLLLVINLFGILILYSANKGQFYYLPQQQFYSFIIFFLLSLLLSTVNLKLIYLFSYFVYFVICALLIFTELFGYTSMGAKRWINLLYFKLQPSELIKIGVILFLARYYNDISCVKVKEFKTLLVPLICVLFPVLLVLKQPDLGTAIIIIGILLSIIFISSVKISHILYVVSPVVFFSPFLWHFLYEYQKKRLLVFLNPELDPWGAGYNIIQSKIAIGSGGILGKGYLNGSQTQLNFLPEKHTDFIFAVLAEEHGFVGVLILLFLYILIILLSALIAIQSRSVFGKILVSGVISLLSLHIIINIGMTSGILPVVGVPLPFMSYGRSTLLTMFLGFGLVMNVYIHQDNNFLRLR